MACVDRKTFFKARVLYPVIVIVIGAVLESIGYGVPCTYWADMWSFSVFCPGVALSTIGWIVVVAGGLWLAYIFIVERPVFCPT